LFWMHDPAEPIGTWAELVEDARGLKVTGQLVLATARGAEALALIKAKALSGLSIGFRARSSERGPNGGRVLTDVELVEISLVSIPAASRARITGVKGAAPGQRAADISAFTTAVRRAAQALRR